MNKENVDCEEVELSEARAMIYVPENACEIEMNIKVFHNGELIIVSRTMDMGEIREAIKKAEDGYIDDDDTFVLTDKGRALLEDLCAERNIYD